MQEPKHVWRFLRPLGGKSTKFEAASPRRLRRLVDWFTWWHWAVLITDLSPGEMLIALHAWKQRGENTGPLGDLYELRRDEQGKSNTLNVVKGFTPELFEDLWSVLIPNYVGVTTAMDFEVLYFGNKIPLE
jgi:hypothetical protein